MHLSGAMPDPYDVARAAGRHRVSGRPDLVSAPKVSLFRIYRDTRFSANKAPLKTNAAAYFPPRGSARHAGAGLYFDIAPRGVWIGGGLYRPSLGRPVSYRIGR